MDGPNQSGLYSANIVRPSFIRLLDLDTILKGPVLILLTVSLASSPSRTPGPFTTSHQSTISHVHTTASQSPRIAMKHSPLSLITWIAMMQSHFSIITSYVALKWLVSFTASKYAVGRNPMILLRWKTHQCLEVWTSSRPIQESHSWAKFVLRLLEMFGNRPSVESIFSL